MNATGVTKDELRRRMRAMRRALPARDARSADIADRLDRLAVVRAAGVVMLFDSIPGEPDTGGIAARSRLRGQEVVLPEEAPDPRRPDVVIVPGLAFTRTGGRLGQGGGWYDRFLEAVRPTCVTIGVAFEEQVLPDVPLEPHDRLLHGLVTDAGTWWTTAHPAAT